MSRTYSKILDCGCWIAEIETDGWEGCADCCADWYDEEDLKIEKNRKHKELHDKCWKEYLEKQKDEM